MKLGFRTNARKVINCSSGTFEAKNAMRLYSTLGRQRWQLSKRHEDAINHKSNVQESFLNGNYWVPYPIKKTIYQDWDEEISIIKIHAYEVRKYLRVIQPNKSTGPDDVLLRVRKECCDRIEYLWTLSLKAYNSLNGNMKYKTNPQ